MLWYRQTGYVTNQKFLSQFIFQISYERNTDVRMQSIMELAHNFLQVFCKGNPQNQVLLHKKLHLFMNPGVSESWEGLSDKLFWRIVSCCVLM